MTLCSRQQLRVNYLMALILVARDRLGPAQRWLEDALRVAESFPRSDAASCLLELSGAINYAQLQFRAASEDFADTIHAVSGGNVPLDSSRSAASRGSDTSTASLLRRQATVELFQEHFETTEDLLLQARGELLFTPDEAETMENAFVHALLQWARGRPHDALVEIMPAAQYFEAHCASRNVARIQAFTADVSLDIAEAAPGGADRDTFIELARAHLAIAREHASGPHDHGALGLVILVRMRVSRILALQEDRENILQYVVKSAERNGDIAMRVQALTALADEYASHGLSQKSGHNYRQVLHLVDHTELPLLGARARWALRHARDQRIE